MEKSERFGFNLPSRSAEDIADIDKISDNFRIIDGKMTTNEEVRELVGTKANIEYRDIPTDTFNSVEVGIEGTGIYTLTNFDELQIDPISSSYVATFGSNEIRLGINPSFSSIEELSALGLIIGRKYEIKLSIDQHGNPTVLNSIRAVIDLKDKVNIEDIDQTYSPTSENAQSGIAVAEATNFRLLCSTEVTQEAFDEASGEIKIISVGNESKTFDGVNQIRILIYLPVSNTINTANSRLAIRATVNAGDSLAPDDTILLKGNGAGESINLLYDKSQYLSATLDFIGNKFVQGICVQNLYGSYTYGTSAYGWTNSPINMGDKKYLHIRSHDNTFKFPVGTTVEVYGR